MSTPSRPSIADARSTPPRFTDFALQDPGVRAVFGASPRWQAWLDVEAALALAQADLGLVPREAADAIAAAARVNLLDMDRMRAAMAVQAHPLVPMLEEFVRVVGQPHGGWVHWGATSQNIMQTGNSLLLRRAHGILSDLVDATLLALADLAERTADMCMAGRTHGQHAVPITFGLKVATWIDEVWWARDRCDQTLATCLRVMIGGAVGSYGSLGARGPDVQQLMAARLQLTSMAVPSRVLVDPLVAYAGDLGLLSAALARIASDVESMMQTEFGEVAEPIGRGSVGSSTMPHKRNPKLANDVLELSADIRALAPSAVAALIHPGEADGYATALVDSVVERSCIWMGDLLVRVLTIIAGLEVFPDRMRANLGLSGGMIGSEQVMLALAEFVGRDQAHAIVYDVAMRAAETAGDFPALLAADERVGAHLDAARLVELLDPAHNVGLSATLAREGATRVRQRLAPHLLR
ncbi:lyase family protein [Propionibacteriaceae bacterium G1746]|uniref:lyase family protein n=1 Tax=Aestuariimicrobium sp. G57 TaxID=3418485 RepID=UPI003C183554